MQDHKDKQQIWSSKILNHYQSKQVTNKTNDKIKKLILTYMTSKGLEKPYNAFI